MRGALLAPSFVEGHIHLDKTLLGLPLIPHQPGGSVADRIAAEKALRMTLDLPIEERGGRLVEQVVGFGTGALRTHVDIDTEVGLAGLEAVLRIKETLSASGRHRRSSPSRRAASCAIPARPTCWPPRSGPAPTSSAASTRPASTTTSPAISTLCSRSPNAQGRGIDIHLHDPGPLGAFELRDIAARTSAAGLQGRVAVSHAYALGAIDAAEFGRTAEALARADVAIMTNAPGVGPMPPVLRLEAAGVTVFAGSDNIRDAWWPYGDGDMLDRAAVIGYRQGFFTNEDLAHGFAMTTELAARVLGLRDYGMAPGSVADLVLLPTPSIPEAVLDRPRGRTVIKRGRVVVRDGELRV